MWGNSKKIAVLVLVLTVLFVSTALWYTDMQEIERQEVLATFPECAQNPGLCPQAENVQVPDTLGIGIVVLALILAGYLFRSDQTQQQILRELRKSDVRDSDKERRELLMSVLKDDEKKVLLAVKEQDGITQSTLALRTDFSKAKLSSLLKELESRDLIAKEVEGKTNKIFLKRKI